MEQEADLDRLGSSTAGQASTSTAAKQPEVTSAAPASEDGDDEEEDSLIIIDRDVSDGMDSKRNSMAAVPDRTEPRSAPVPEQSTTVRHE